MFHMFDCIRVNAYIISKSLMEKPLSHKEFIKEWVKVLCKRAAAASLSSRRESPRKADETAASFTTPKTKRQRMSHVRPTLSTRRYEGTPSQHKAVTCERCYANGKQKPRACVFCSYERACAKILGTAQPKMHYTVKKCFFCDEYLCKKHFEAYHAMETTESLSV